MSRRKSTKKVVAAPVVEVKDFWFNTNVREAAREEHGTTPSANRDLAERLLLVMTAKRDLRRMSESEGGSKPPKLFLTPAEATTVIEDAKRDFGMSLKALKQLARSTVFNGMRVFDLRHPAEEKE